MICLATHTCSLYVLTIPAQMPAHLLDWIQNQFVKTIDNPYLHVDGLCCMHGAQYMINKAVWDGKPPLVRSGQGGN